jgi:hypothetical protein
MRTVVAVLTLLVAAPSALADDAAIFNAYTAQQPRMDALSNKQRRAYDDAGDNPSNRNGRRIIRLDQRMNAVLGRISDAVSAEPSSSDDGARAQQLAVGEAGAWIRANRVEIKSIRATIAGEYAKGRRLIDKAIRIMKKQTFPAGRKAVRAFKAAGLTSPEGALSAKKGT